MGSGSSTASAGGSSGTISSGSSYTLKTSSFVMLELTKVYEILCKKIFTALRREFFFFFLFFKKKKKVWEFRDYLQGEDFLVWEE